LTADQRHQRIELHFALQRLLKPFTVVVPYSNLLADSLCVSNVEMRRGLALFLSAIEACALLHQRQRQLDEQGRVMASDHDFAVVAELLSGWLVENLGGGVSKATGQFYQWLLAEFGENQDICIPACQQRGRSEGQANYQLSKLAQAGLVQQVNDRAGGRGRPKVFRLVVGKRAQQTVGLPSVQAVREFLQGTQR
jgi:hypothetical protein